MLFTTADDRSDDIYTLSLLASSATVAVPSPQVVVVIHVVVTAGCRRRDRRPGGNDVLAMLTVS